MNTYIYTTILILSSLIFSSTNILAQVKIGDTTPPAEFSVLEIETLLKKGGLRIPQLTQNQCDQLRSYLLTNTEKKQSAIGLVIFNLEYNEDGGMMLYWNGEDWASSKALSLLQEGNGVTVIDPISGGLRLGGTLKESQTNVDLNEYTLNVPLLSNESSFGVTNSNKKENTLIVKSGKVGIGGTASPTKTFDIYNSDPNLSTFKLDDGRQKQGYLLGSDGEGNASWQALLALASVVEGEINIGAEFGHTTKIPVPDPKNPNNTIIKEAGGGDDCYITKTPLHLQKGKWLIVAKFTSMTNTDVLVTGGSPSNELLAYMSLRKSTIPDPDLILGNTTVGNYSDIPLAITGALPSAKHYYENPNDRKNYYYAMPQVFYFAEVEEDEAYFHILANSSGKHQVISDHGNYFFALRIDGPQMTVAAEGTIDCNALTATELTLKTNQEIVNGPIVDVTFTLTKGSLTLRDGAVIGNNKGVQLVVVQGPYPEIKNDGVPVTVKVQLQGQLKSNVESGEFRVPVNLSGTTFTNICEGVKIIVPREGSINCGTLPTLEINTGRGKSLNIDSNIELSMVSGSVTFEGSKVLVPTTDGIEVIYANPLERTFYAPYPREIIPVQIRGTISNTASGQINLVPSINVPGIVDCSQGIIINVVIGSFNCGSTLEYPSNIPINSTEKIQIQLASNSAPYTLKAGRSGLVLGSNSGVSATYFGADLAMVPGETYTIDVLISSSNRTLPVDSYTVPLSNLDQVVKVGIASCNMPVKVMHYGYFDPVSFNVSIPVPVEGVATPTTFSKNIAVPLTFTETNKSITINNGDILGTSGNYKVVVKTAEPITVNSPQTINIQAVASGPIKTNGTQSIIPLDKVAGIKTADVTINFVN